MGWRVLDAQDDDVDGHDAGLVELEHVRIRIGFEVLDPLHDLCLLHDRGKRAQAAVPVEIEYSLSRSGVWGEERIGIDGVMGGGVANNGY